MSFSDEELFVEFSSGGQSIREYQSISIKILAVNETKQKLIGIFALKLNLKDFQDIRLKSYNFDKCIDKQASLVLSVKRNFQDTQIQKKLKTTFDKEANLIKHGHMSRNEK